MDKSKHSHPDNIDKFDCREEVNNKDDRTKRMEKAKEAHKKDLQNKNPEPKMHLARNMGVGIFIVVLLYFINRLTEPK